MYSNWGIRSSGASDLFPLYSEYISFLKFFLAESNITAKCVGFYKLSSDFESSNNLKSILQKPLTAPTGNPSLFLVKGGRA